jgi:hypothetical protein
MVTVAGGGAAAWVGVGAGAKALTSKLAAISRDTPMNVHCFLELKVRVMCSLLLGLNH